MGDLGLGEVGVVAQDQHLALARRQRSQGVQNGVALGAADRLGLGTAMAAPAGCVGRSRVAGVLPVDDHSMALHGPAPVDHGGLEVADDPTAVPDRGPAAVGRHEGVLHDVLGGELVSQEEPGQADEPVPVRSVELGDRDVGVGRQLGRPGVSELARRHTQRSHGQMTRTADARLTRRTGSSGGSDGAGRTQAHGDPTGGAMGLRAGAVGQPAAALASTSTSLTVM
jgi:hypothetical protein